MQIITIFLRGNVFIYVGGRKPTVAHPYATLCCYAPAAGFFSPDRLTERRNDSSVPGETAVVLKKTAVVLEELLLFWNTFLMCFLKYQGQHLN